MLSKVQSGPRSYVTTVTEKVEYPGMWWVRDEPTKPLPGVLSITPEDRPVLSVNGSYSEEAVGRIDEFPRNYGRIDGVSANGLEFALECCSIRRRSFGVYRTESFDITLVYQGNHLFDLDNLVFTRFVATYTFFDKWSSRRPIERPTKTEAGFVIPYESGSNQGDYSITAQLGEVEIGLQSTTDFVETSDSASPVRMNVWNRVEVTCSKSLPVSEVKSRYLDPICNLLSLASNRANSITRLAAYHPKVDWERVLDALVDIHTRSIYPAASTSKLWSGLSLFYPRHIQVNPTHHLKCWLDSSATIPDVHELFFGLLSDPYILGLNRFLNVHQALEAYWRFKYHHRVNSVLSKNDLKTFTNNLRPMIDELVPNPDSFAKWVIDTRNYLTHLNRNNKQLVANSLELYYMTESLIWMMRINLLLEAGFEKGTCAVLLGENQAYGDFCSYIPHVAPWAKGTTS